MKEAQLSISMPSLAGQDKMKTATLIAASKRHNGVQNTTKIALLLSVTFGVFTIILAATNEKYEEDFNIFNNYKAYEMSIAVDRSRFVEELRQATSKCGRVSRYRCKEIVSLLISIQNRAKDYKTLLVDSLKLGKSSFAVKQYENIEREINSTAKSIYGLSLSEAKILKLLTPEQYITHLELDKFKAGLVSNQNPSNLSNKTENGALRAIFLLTTSKLATASFPSVDQLVLDYNVLVAAYFAVITLEVSVFILVSIIQIWNIKAEPSKDYGNYKKANYYKFPLILCSILFSLITIICAQYLLGRELTAMKYKKCREFNELSVIFSGQISPLDSSGVLTYFRNISAIPKFCAEKFSIDESKAISSLNQMRTLEKGPNIEIYQAVLTEQADALHRLGEQSSENTNKILYSMLTLNVMVLICTTAILRHESLEIDQTTD